MQIAIDAAGFKPEKADKLRRAMATFAGPARFTDSRTISSTA